MATDLEMRLKPIWDERVASDHDEDDLPNHLDVDGDDMDSPTAMSPLDWTIPMEMDCPPSSIPTPMVMAWKMD